jgi:NADPH:quinone reductase-like Zn-dependent oxidoreductase
MKAIVWTKYGPPEVLQLKEVEKPTPKDNEVLIKIYATTVTLGDCEMRNLKLPFLLSFPMRIYSGIIRPKRITILGQELAGEIESIGKDVKLFKEGDQVFAATGFGLGAYAQYICLAEEPEEGALALKPVNMIYKEAATVPFGGLEALHFLKQAGIENGQKVLINGAGGSIGTFSVQLAKYYGAEVTAVDSLDKLDMLLAIGADRVIDYTKEDFTKNGQVYDVIFDIIGKSPYSDSIRSLNKNGSYLLANPSLSQMIRAPWASKRREKKVIIGAANYRTEDLVFLKELIETEKIKTVIDRSYPLEEIPEAHRYVETGSKKGNVVITVDRDL